MSFNKENSDAKARASAFEVLHEDNHIIVVSKAFNTPVMADESKDSDLQSEIKAWLKEKYSKPGNVFLGLVHRLDRPTGGVMVFAKTGKAAERLSKAIAAREFEKKYYAVLCGAPREPRGVLKNFLKKDTATNTVSVVPESTEGAKYAELSYLVLDSTPELSLADVTLVTGRPHQIRVQFKNIGTPVYGDIRYGGDKIRKGGNLALFAYHLRFEHPTTKALMAFRAAPPYSELPWAAFPGLEAAFENIIHTGDAVRLALPGEEI